MNEMSLPKMLETLDSVDRQLIDMPMEELDAVSVMLPTKVDNLYHFMDHLEARIDHMKEHIHAMQETVRLMQKKHKSVEEWVGNALTTYGFDKVPGIEYDLSVRSSTSVEIDENFDMASLATQYPAFVRVKYELDKVTTGDCLKGGMTLPFARLKTTNRAKFTLRRRK